MVERNVSTWICTQNEEFSLDLCKETLVDIVNIINNSPGNEFSVEPLKLKLEFPDFSVTITACDIFIDWRDYEKFFKQIEHNNLHIYLC